MTPTEWNRQQEEARRRYKDEERRVGAALYAVLAVLLWVPGRAIYFINNVPGGDLNWDRKFSIGDFWMALELSFTEPLFYIYRLLGPEVFSFFEVTMFTVPLWINIILSITIWVNVIHFGGRGIYLTRTGLRYFGEFMKTSVARIFKRKSSSHHAQQSGVLIGDVVVGGILLTLVMAIFAASLGFF